MDYRRIIIAGVGACYAVILLMGAAYNFGGSPVISPPIISNQAQGAAADQPVVSCISNGSPWACCTGFQAGGTCSTANPTTPGIDPTANPYNAKGDVRGAGAWFGTTGDGSYSTTDATCGSSGRCFNSPSGNFAAGDIGKIFAIVGVSSQAPVGKTPFSMDPASDTAYVTVSAVTSATEITISVAPTISSGTYTSLPWVMGTNDMSAFQSAINAGDLHIPNHFYFIAPHNNGGNSNAAGASVAVPSYRDIWCDPGATLINPNFDTLTPGATTSIFDIGAGNNNYVIRGCTFEQLNTATGGPYLPASSQSAFGILVDSNNTALGGDNVAILHNTFAYIHGQAGIEIEPTASNADFSNNVALIENTFKGCALYGPAFIAGKGILFVGNHITDCDVGTEPNNTTEAANQVNILFMDNDLTCINGSGDTGLQFGIRSVSGGASMINNFMVDNYMTGTAKNYCAFIGNNGVNNIPSTMINNQTLNGATFR